MHAANVREAKDVSRLLRQTRLAAETGKWRRTSPPRKIGSRVPGQPESSSFEWRAPRVSHQTFTQQSSPQDTIRLPSGLKATAHTVDVCPMPGPAVHRAGEYKPESSLMIHC